MSTLPVCCLCKNVLKQLRIQSCDMSVALHIHLYTVDEHNIFTNLHTYRILFLIEHFVSAVHSAVIILHSFIIICKLH